MTQAWVVVKSETRRVELWGIYFFAIFSGTGKDYWGMQYVV